MKKYIYLLLLLPVFAFGQAPTNDSTKLTAPPTIHALTFNSLYIRGANASNAQVGFLDITTGKWIQLLTGYQANHYFAPIGSGVTSVIGTVNRLTASPTSGNVVLNISSTFEALLGKVANPLSQFASTTSSQLAGVISDETGSGSLVFATSPILVTPNLGTPSALVGTNITGTATALNIGGNAATATNSTKWNNLEILPFSFGAPFNLGGLYGYDNIAAKMRPYSQDTIKTWLGLGSNAYASTPYLPFSNYTVPHSGVVFKGKKIVWFGDSYTEGTGASDTTLRFTSLASKYLQAIEVNKGIGGTTIEDRVPVDYQGHPNMVSRIADIPTYTTDYGMLVFAYGLNDMGQTATAYNTTNYTTDYTTVIAAAFGKSWPASRILLIPPFYIGAAGYSTYGAITGNPAPTRQRHLDFIEATKQLANTYGLMYFDIFQDQKANDTTLFADVIHPNDAGHKYIANDIIQYLGQSQDNYSASALNGVQLSGLGTGILKNTTVAGVPSIAVSGDFPTLNQNTTGNANTATAWATGRTLSITGDLAYTSPSINGSGNVTATGTLPTVNSNVGSFGSSTSIPSLTVDAKGRLTAASGNAVIAPASTLTGTTLASNVVIASLTNLSALTTNGLVTTSGGTGALSVTGTTGSGNVVLSSSPTLVTPNLGTPSTLVGTNISGTASGLSIGGHASLDLPLTGGQITNSSALVDFLKFADTNTGGATWLFGPGTATGNSNQFNLFTGSTYGWTVLKNGNFGINNTNPGSLFNVGSNFAVNSSGNITGVLPAYSSGTNLPVVYNSTNSRFETSTASTAPVIVAFGDLPGQTVGGQILSPSTYTVGASDGSFLVTANLNITAISADVIQTQVTYTDETNTSTTLVFYGMGLTSAGLTTTGVSNYAPMGEIRAKAGTTITCATVLTTSIGSITFNAHATVTQIR